MTAEEKIWWYASNGQEFGPYTAKELQSFALSGRLTPADLIWREGLEKWLKASSVKGLFDPPKSPSPRPAAAASKPPAPQASPAQEKVAERPAEKLTTPSVQTSRAGQLDDQEAMRIFVGDKYYHYVNKWSNLAEKKLAWSWVGFFLTIYWMIYRKMYRYAALFFAAMAGMEILIYGLNVSGSAGMAINIAFRVLIGLQGNYWYKLHAEQKIKRIKENIVPEKRKEELALQGGTNLKGALICFFLVMIMTAAGMFVLIRTMIEMGGFPPQ